MRRPSPIRPLPAALALLIALAPTASAQNTAPALSRDSTPQGTPKSSAPRVLTLADYGKWSRITSPAISADGKWMTYIIQPNEGDATLHARQLDGAKVHAVSVGTTPQGGGGGAGGFGGGAGASAPVISDDSRFVGYFVNPAARDLERSRRGARPGIPGGPGAVQAAGGAARPPARRFEVLDLATGEKFSVANAASFKFANGGRWLAVRKNEATPDTTRDGADLVLRDLATGETRNIGNVRVYEFDDAGKLLAYTVDAVDRVGNGLYVVELASGATRPLATAAADFDQVAWSSEGASLAVLRGEKKKENKQKDNVLLAWTGVGSAKMTSLEYDPAKDASFPKGMVLSEFAAPRWSRDGSRLFVGVKEQEPDPDRGDEPQANVDVWHWKDPEPQSVQMVRLQQERRSTYPAVITLSTKKLVQLGDREMRSVQATANGKWGIGRLDTPYRGEVAWGGSRADYYRVSTATGERTPIESSITRTMGTSPDGRWFLYLKDKHVYAYDLETGKKVDLDDGESISFVDVDDDHPYELPTYGVAGWSRDGRSVLLNHKFDIWQVPLDGGRATNLTGGVGEKEQIRFRIVRLDRRGGGGGGRGGRFAQASPDEEDEGIDLTRPLLLSAYGEWTKKSGYHQLVPGKQPTPLIWADKSIGTPQKARNADRVIFTQSTFREFPDYWVSGTSFASPRKVTDANPQLAEYAWGSKVLIDYTNGKGQKLQGTLTLPAGYEPGKKYPMLVYFYEKMSQQHHGFSMPTYDDRPHISTYSSNGYLVLQPDVVYEIGKPGTSALDCVTSAVKKVIELGYADPKRIGLQGHSWGGYQSSFIVTQTDMFAAVVTGAPPTNLVSFYNELYKSTGTVQQGIMELGQVRMGAGVTPWTAHELYESQSPVHNVQNIKTPFLILHGTEDGAVDWHQGLEYFNAARRNGKQVILLSYPGEPHHLARRENQKDFQIRMKQFFDHYLKGAPAPKWMTDGVPQTRKGETPIEEPTP